LDAHRRVYRREADFVIGSRNRGNREPGAMLGLQIFAGCFSVYCFAFLAKVTTQR
jgi:hypothetical protein